MPRYEVKIHFTQQNTYFVDAKDENEAYDKARELWDLDVDPHEVNFSRLNDYEIRQVKEETKS